MSLLQAFLQAIDSLATGAAPADRLRFPLRDADQATLTSATVSDGGTARPDRLVLELEPDTTAGAGPPEILPLFPGFVTFAADDPDASKAVPDPDDPGFDWTDPAAWPTQGRLRVDLDRPALETLMAKAGAAFPVVPTRADYWPVVLPPDWLTEDAVRALAERKTVRRTGHPAVPHGTARWRKHALAAFLAGEHRLRVAPPPDDDHRADFAFPTAPLDANGKATLTFALSRPVAEPDDGAAAEVAAAAGTLTPAHPDHPLNQELPVRRVLQALRGELGSAGALALEVTADWPLGPRWFGVATGTPGEPATPPYALGALAEQAVEVRAGATLLQQRQLPLHGLISVAQHRGSAAAEPSPPTLTVSFPGGPLSVAGTNVADPGDATRLLADLAAEPAPWAALMPALPAARAALVSRCAAITKCQRTRRAVTDHLHEYARRIRPAAWNGDTRAGPAFDEIFHGSRTPWSYIDAAAFERLFAAVELVGFTDPAHPVTVRRPPHALLLWLMEGLLSERSAKVIRPGWRTLTDIGVGWLVNFSPAEVAAATPGQIRTTVRVAMFWAFYGLDINNWHVPGVADNQPRLNSPIADTVANHDEAWRVANAAIVAAGIQPPDRAAVNATIAVRHNPAPAGRWEFKLAPGFGAAMLACQYAEYLRRLVALPAAAQPYASFPYAAYNGNPTRVTNQFFNPAAAEIAADPAKWSGKDHEDVLMSRRLAGTEVSRGSPPPPRERSIDPKVQILHVAALADAWARHLPATWPAP